MDRQRVHETEGDEPFTMRDGRQVRVRRIRPDDAPRLQALHDRLSERSRRMRFFVGMKRLGESFAQRLASVDFDARAAFVVSHDEDDAIHAVGRYERSKPGSAEVAFVVEDAYQGEGLATELLHHLASHAASREIREFTAVTLIENREMMEVFRHSGYPMTVSLDPPVETVTLDLAAGGPVGYESSAVSPS